LEGESETIRCGVPATLTARPASSTTVTVPVASSTATTAVQKSNNASSDYIIDLEIIIFHIASLNLFGLKTELLDLSFLAWLMHFPRNGNAGDCLRWSPAVLGESLK
jgi:hypothetical protein